MAWISSTFGEDVLENVKQRKRGKITSFKPSKKLCTNLWVDEFPPLSLEELSVHKKKIQEVQDWLKEAGSKMQGRKLLLLTGPPGSAKSTVIRTLAKEMRLNMREWATPNISKSLNFKELGLDYIPDIQFYERGNEAERFSEFIFRSSKYRNICSSHHSGSSLVLIEEVPNIFIMNPLLFHDTIRKYSAVCSTPVVFIFSDSNKDNVGKTLFPSDIQEELSITNIVFNPISPSLLLSGLNRVVLLTSSTNSPFFDSISMPKKQFLQRVAESSGGDIRSAVNTLQFTVMKGVGMEGKGERSRMPKKRDSSLEDLVGAKDSSLILFRALGKVLYCKRDISGGASDVPPLPPPLRAHERKPLLEDPEEVFERSATDTSTFSLFLHHNCPSFFSGVEGFAAALQYFGDADIISSHWDPSKQLETYGSSVSIRGMMHSLNEGKKEGQGFRSLTRPSWYQSLHTTKDRTQRAKSLSRVSSLTSEELFAVHVPLIAKTFLSSDAEVDVFFRDVGLLYPPPQTRSDAQKIVPSSRDSINQGFDALDQEEFHIEEFQD